MLIYNLLEYNQNYSMKLRSFRNYYGDEVNDADDNAYGKSFKYKAKMVEKTSEKPERLPQPPQNPDGTQPIRPPQPAVPSLNVETTILLKYLCNFWRFFDFPLINCEIEFDLAWAKDCVLIEHHSNIARTNFMITSTKFDVPVVTLTINDNI